MRTVLITGGSRGIGRAIVDWCGAQGWKIEAPARDELDLTKPASVEAYCTGLRSRHVQALINNAGVNYPEPFLEVSSPRWDEMLQVNVSAPRCLIAAVAPAMARAGSGRIVNVSSIFSKVSREGRASYSATKAALNSLTRTAAIELGPHGILVNAVCPGYVNTDLTKANNRPEDLARICKSIPLGRLGEPAEIARVIGFLCSEENTYLTGQSLVVDGGFLCQ